MEQDCVAGLYRSLGMSVGAEFSSADVSLLYRKVFCVPSDTDEAHVAMKKIAGGDNSWSCVGENVLDVLIEMEREREKKEQLYWDLQLLNAGNPDTLCVMGKPAVIDHHVLNCLHQSSDPNTFKKADQSDSESLQSCTFDTVRLQRERLVRGKEQDGSVRGVKRLKLARHCWARLASEGAKSILPSPWQGQSQEVRGQAWGCVSLSDVLLLVEVKYDVVTHLLYTEMLQVHYTLSIWETLLPWQKHKEEEGLEDLAEEALESGDMLRLAELPGAFRIYRTCLGEYFRSRPESGEQGWSAVSLLWDLHTFHQHERDTLRVLGERLDRESLRLLCLYIRLATLRAQREKMSYSSLLAARQSWETWPQVKSPCRAEQAAQWLLVEVEDQKKDFISESPQQQAVLQLLVLTQEQERKYLVKLVHGISLEDLQEQGSTVPPREDNHTHDVLRNGCIKRLRQIKAGLHTLNETQIPLQQTNPQPQLQPQMQAYISSQPAMWSQHQLENCSLILLTHLMELQEVQASALLSALMDKSTQGVQALRDEYESALQANCYTNLLQLLVSDAPLTSCAILTPCPNITEISHEHITAQSCCSGPVEAQNSCGGPAEAPRVVSLRRASREMNRVQAADETDKQDICTGCGVAVEELPYLEILCVSDGASNTHLSLAAEGRAQEKLEGSAAKSLQSYEKQGSLIALAWSKLPDDDTDFEAEAAVRGAGQSKDVESSSKTQVQTSDMSSTAEHTECEETSLERDREDLFQSDSTGDPDGQSADQQCNTVGQLTFEERAIVDQQEEGEAVSHCDLQTYASVAETLQDVQPHNVVDLPEIKRHAGDLCSGLTNETANVDREVAEVEVCPTATETEQWDLRGPEPAQTEDEKCNSRATVDCSPAERETPLMERERAREPVSAVERERTMRNLVDMQRKVEQRQQRDRERQLLRVQERLSIIQNRKAEEDLLGLKHTDRLRHLTQDLPQEDKNQQKTVVRERLEQLRRERSHVMQSKRDRNTAGFKELLGPVALHSRETDDGAD